MKKILPLLIIVALILSAGVWVWTKRESTVSKSLFAMGTVFEITASGSNPTPAIKSVFQEIKRIEYLTSTQNDSELAKLNQAAGIGPVKVSPELMTILKTVAKMYPDLSGTFDPTVGPLIELWGFNPQGRPHLPDSQKIADTLPLIGFNRVKLDDNKRTAFLPIKGMKLDLGGIAKGYAVDQAYLTLRKAGIHSALINGGSSSIRVIGKRTDRNHWRLGIGHPRQTGELLGALGLPEDRALGTSADNQNFFIHNGQRYTHLIDPRTGYPARDKILVTATAPTAIEADLLSTAFFVLPVSTIKAYLKTNPEYGAIIFDASGKMVNLGEATFRAD